MSRLSIFCPACGSRMRMVVSLVPVQVACPNCHLDFVVNPSMAAAVAKVNGITHETISPHPPPPITRRLVRRRNFRGYLKVHYREQIAVNGIVILLLIGLVIAVDVWIPQAETFNPLIVVGCIAGIGPAVFNIVRLWKAARDIRNH